jgi:putative transposase
VTRGKKKPKTTNPGASERPDDLVKRNFTAEAPDRLLVADLTYVATTERFCYTAFVTDVFSRAIAGWAVSKSLSATVALDALEMAIWRRHGDLDGAVHHSDRGCSTSQRHGCRGICTAPTV